MSPASAVAGSTADSFVFTFTAKAASSSRLSVVVPSVASGTPWTKPQSSNAAGKGYVAADHQTCQSASIASIASQAGGVWRIGLDAQCAKGKDFTLTYGAGTGARVTAATLAGSYTFATRQKLAGGSSVALSPQPAIKVTPAAAARLQVTDLVDGKAGALQSPTVTAFDAFGNVARGYRGTVHFFGTGEPAAYAQPQPLYAGWDRYDGFRPCPRTTPSSLLTPGGTPSNAVRIIFTGAQTLRVSDLGVSSIKGMQTATISPLKMSFIDLLSPVIDKYSVLQGQPALQRMSVAALDHYGNIATSFEKTVLMSYSISGEGSETVLPDHFDLVKGKASANVTWPPPTDYGLVAVNIRGRYHVPVVPPAIPHDETFTRELEYTTVQPDDTPEVVELPPDEIGQPPVFELHFPDEIVLQPELTMANIDLHANGIIELELQGITTVSHDLMDFDATFTSATSSSGSLITSTLGLPKIRPDDHGGWAPRTYPTSGSPTEASARW